MKVRSAFPVTILLWQCLLTNGFVLPSKANVSISLNSAASDGLTNKLRPIVSNVVRHRRKAQTQVHNHNRRHKSCRESRSKLCMNSKEDLLSAPTNDEASGVKERSQIQKNRKKVMVGTLNLIKAMAGTGILALPMGVAKSSDFKASIIPAIALMSILGITSAYTFMLYGRLIHDCQAKSLGELWEKKMNKNSAWLVSAVSLTFCYGACLAYTLCLGDVSRSLAQTIGLNGACSTREFWIILFVTTILYPLCNLKSLISLAPLSLAGVGSVLITGIFIAWRCPFLNRSSPYSTLALDSLLKTLSPEQIPTFQTMNKGFLSPSSLILFGMAASAYLGHFTAPDLYHSLREKEEESDGEDDDATDCLETPGNFPSKQSAALRSFSRVSMAGFLSTIVINCFIMTFGFLTFGGNSMGVILNNFSTLDKGATICRLLTTVSIVGGYPFLIRACRGEILELYNLKTSRKPTRQDEKVTTVMLLSSLALLSMILSDAGAIIGLAGAVMGSALVYIFPSLMYLSTTKKISKGKTRFLTFERILCKFLVVFGTFAAFTGALTVATGG